MVGQLEARKAMTQSPPCVKGDLFSPRLTALLVAIRFLLRDELSTPRRGKCCSREQSACTAPPVWSEGCRQNREDISSFVEPHFRAAPLTFAPSLGGRGDIAKKNGYCPFLQSPPPGKAGGCQQAHTGACSSTPLRPHAELQKGPLWHVSFCRMESLNGTRVQCLGLVSGFPFLPKTDDAFGPAQGGQVLSECPFRPLGHQL